MKLIIILGVLNFLIGIWISRNIKPKYRWDGIILVCVLELIIYLIKLNFMR